MSRILASLVALSVLVDAGAKDNASATPEPAAVLSLMERAADWQLANLPKPRSIETDDPPRHAEYSPRGWVMGAWYAGVMALAEISPSHRFMDAMRQASEKNAWKPGPRPYHADDHAVIQLYAALALRDPAAAELRPSIERFDFVLAHPAIGSLEFTRPEADRQWTWCDALFMAPPAWVLLGKVTGKAAYRDFAMTQWWKTSAYLFDPAESLFFRDSTYFEKREKNGKKVFWSRGNGWVFAGLARMLEYLPTDDPARPRFEEQYRAMAAKLISLQRPNGFWTSSLLDPEEYSADEASGTAFHTFALLWGINHCLLDRETYLRPALAGWAALATCVQPDGKLHHVQPIGADPRKFDPTQSEPFAVGAFLLAGREAFRFAQNGSGK
jgi:unsaturated rhamnogalacturonyl hydrolase